tara:strand:+ start:66 stop:254 length:189 start_codon:yes stop_codon:yes gene_type:complete
VNKMNYEKAKKMNEWNITTDKRKIELDWDLPNLNILIRQDGRTRIVSLTELVDRYMETEELQ